MSRHAGWRHADGTPQLGRIAWGAEACLLATHRCKQRLADLDRSLLPRSASGGGADTVSLIAAPPPPKKPTKTDGPSAEVVAIWEAEDGRCEACTRAMDKTCARVVTLPPSSVPRLLCPDCKQHRPDPLTTAVVGPQTVQALVGARATTVEASAAWLVEGHHDAPGSIAGAYPARGL